MSIFHSMANARKWREVGSGPLSKSRWITTRAPRQEWTLDFASDVTAAGQRFRVLGVIDN
jgi:hypothetical protein